jgi:hypothetical protein
LNDGVEQPLVADAGVLDLRQETVQAQLIVLYNRFSKALLIPNLLIQELKAKRQIKRLILKL